MGHQCRSWHLIEKGIPVMSNGDGTYSYGLDVDFRKMEFEKDKLTLSVNKHLR